MLLLSATQSQPRRWVTRYKRGLRSRLEATEKRRRGKHEGHGQYTSECGREFVAEVLARRLRRDSKTINFSVTPRFVPGVAIHGYERWTGGDVLSKLLSGNDGSGVLDVSLFPHSSSQTGMYKLLAARTLKVLPI